MKILCNCNSKWEKDSSSLKNSVFQLVVVGKGKEEIDLGVCCKCGKFRWINPQYENMMFDLRGMNT